MIRRLDQATVERIAAGEVVERPSSVVKELVENAIDAGADHIRVELKDGGSSYILVSDNGCGIPGNELPLALESHTTSKIESDADLWSLSTLGFRGEALASIAAVSRLTVISRTPEGEGARITCEGGVSGKVTPHPRPIGTTVVVEDLFYNTPARREFMSSPRSETARVVKAVGDTSLAHLDVAFEVVSNGVTLVDLPATADPLSRLARLHSHAEAKEMVRVDGGAHDMSVTGYLTRPGITRSNRSKLVLLVNFRPITSAELSKAVMLGYDQRLAKGRFPYGFIHVKLPPAEVDVNVSPTKSTVRFKDTSAVVSAVARAVRDAMEAASSESVPVPTMAAHRSAPSLRTPSVREGSPRKTRAPTPSPSLRQKRFPADTSQLAPGDPSEVVIIGQFLNSYIIAAHGDDLLIVDQHAADERNGYERQVEFLRRGSIPSQRLLSPLVIECPPAVVERLSDIAQVLERAGFSIEPFGPGQLKVDAIPNILGKLLDTGDIGNVLDELLEEGLFNSTPDHQDRLAKLVACKAAVKANTPLGDSEMRRIVTELLSKENPHNCPHGRPTFLKMKRSRLERDFLRT